MNASELATLGGGCFWGVESILKALPGVLKTEAGYSGGPTSDPTYEQVCSGRTGHAEVVQVTFDPSKISFSSILDYFWRLHDPTQVNRQGGDVGTQYRSIVLYHSDAQKSEAEESMKRFDRSGVFSNLAVTEVSPFETFYPAESYHQDYYGKNPGRVCHLLRER